MAVFAIPNPKKTTQVDFPIDRVKLSVLNINLENNKYKFTKANEIFNQYTYEATEFLSLGVYIDINLNKISDEKTEITVEIRRKIGTFDQSFEVTKANEHLVKVFDCIANLTAKTPEEVKNLKKVQIANLTSKKRSANNYKNTGNYNQESHSSNNAWYEKTWLVVVLCIIFFPVGLYALWKNSSIAKGWKIVVTSLIVIILVTNIGDDKKEIKTTTKNDTIKSDVKSVKISDLETLKIKLKNSIKSMDGDYLTSDQLKSAQEFTIAVALFKAYAITINEGKINKDKEVQNLVSELETKLVKYQINNFPKLRKAYYELLKEKLWENDVDVSLSGKNNTTLSFTGGYFAANKNIATTQESLNEMLTYLHFKKTEYRWYKNEDEFTYYSIKSDNDSAIKTE